MSAKLTPLGDMDPEAVLLEAGAIVLAEQDRTFWDGGTFEVITNTGLKNSTELKRAVDEIGALTMAQIKREEAPPRSSTVSLPHYLL